MTIIQKILSGRYLMTITTSGVFAYMALKGLMSEQQVADIIKMVFMFYFLKKVDSNDKTK